jgi:hypothetical protein
VNTKGRKNALSEIARTFLRKEGNFSSGTKEKPHAKG